MNCRRRLAQAQPEPHFVAGPYEISIDLHQTTAALTLPSRLLGNTRIPNYVSKHKLSLKMKESERNLCQVDSSPETPLPRLYLRTEKKKDF